MTIAEKIREKYPIRINLPYPVHKNRVSITCADTEFKEKLNELMKQMSLSEMYSDTAYANDVSVVVFKNSAGYAAKVTTISGECVYGLSGTTPEWTCAWLAYALVTGAPWLQDIDSDLNVVLYSSRQQTAASRMKIVVNYHYSAEVDLSEIIRRITDAGVQRLLRTAPRFCERPITETGWNYRSSFRGLFSREVSLAELSQNLYGKSDFADEIKEYVQALKKTTEYNKAVTDAVNALFNTYIYNMPLVNVLESMEMASSALKRPHTNGIPEADIRNLFSGKCKIKKITPEELESAFREITKAYFETEKAQLFALFSSDLCDMSLKRLERERREALPKLSELSRSLESFGILGMSESDMRVPWNILVNIEKVDIPNGEASWTNESFTNGVLYNSRCAPGDYSAVSFLCSDKIHSLTSRDTPHSVYPVRGLSSGIVVAVYSKPLQATSEVYHAELG